MTRAHASQWSEFTTDLPRIRPIRKSPALVRLVLLVTLPVLVVAAAVMALVGESPRRQGQGYPVRLHDLCACAHGCETGRGRGR